MGALRYSPRQGVNRSAPLDLRSHWLGGDMFPRVVLSNFQYWAVQLPNKFAVAPLLHDSFLQDTVCSAARDRRSCLLGVPLVHLQYSCMCRCVSSGGPCVNRDVEPER